MKALKLSVITLSVLPAFSTTYPSSPLLVCDPTNQPFECDQGVDPVCAITTTNQSYTAASSCAACLDPSIKYYAQGECQNEQAPREIFCNSNSTLNAPEKDQIQGSICAVFDDCNQYNCNQPNQPVASGSAACGDSDAISFITGDCPTQPQKIVCDPDNRPESCGNRTEIVCGFSKEDSNGERTTKTLPSSCYACIDEEVEYYIPGTCANDVKEGKNFCGVWNIPNRCAPITEDSYNPVCVFQRDCEGEGCTETHDIPCNPCGYGYGADYYVFGACKTFCSSKSVEDFCAEDSGAVCAYGKECSGDDCGKTMDNSCMACGDGNVEYFTEGECRKIVIP